MTPGAFLQGVQARAKSSLSGSNARELPVDTSSCEFGISSGETTKRRQKAKLSHGIFVMHCFVFVAMIPFEIVVKVPWIEVKD